MIKKIQSFVKKYWWLAAIWYGMKFTLLIFTILWLTSCENTYKANKNYIYTFQGTTHKDNLGRKVYGGHHFITDEKIQDMESFKECYVNFLDWYMGDNVPKKVYYQDHKNVTITFDGTTPARFTLPEINNCQ